MSNFCGQCGQPVAATNRFCPQCGAASADGARPPPPTAVSTPSGKTPWKWVLIPLAVFGGLFGLVVLASTVWVMADAFGEKGTASASDGTGTVAAPPPTPSGEMALERFNLDALPDEARRDVERAFRQHGTEEIESVPGAPLPPHPASGQADGGGAWGALGGGGGTPAADTRPRGQNPVPAKPPASATAGKDEFRVVYLNDPLMDNQEAYRAVVPGGWRAEGKLLWTLQSVATPVTFWMRYIRNDNQAEVLSVSAFSFWANPPLGQLGVTERGYLYGYKVMDRMAPEAYFTWFLNNSREFGVTNIRVDQTVAHPMQALIDTATAQSPIPAGERLSMTVRAVRGQCTHNGRVRRFLAYPMVVAKPLPNNTGVIWEGMFHVLFAEPAALASAENDLDYIFAFGKANQHWQQLILAFTDAVNAVMRERQSAGWALAEKIRDDCSRRVDEIIRRNQPKYSATDITAHAWSQYIRDVDSYALPDGGTVEIPTKYDTAFLGPNGRIVTGPRTMSPGAGYTELRKMRPFE